MMVLMKAFEFFHPMLETPSVCNHRNRRIGGGGRQKDSTMLSKMVTEALLNLPFDLHLQKKNGGHEAIKD